MANSPDAVAECLRATQSPDFATRTGAEEALAAAAAAPGFTMLVLGVVDAYHADVSVAQGASLLFKNHVKKHWVVEEGETDIISPAEREKITTSIIELMCTSSKQVQRVLTEALAIICSTDFPDGTPGLLPELVGRLDAASKEGNIHVINALLELANSIFKRFRNTIDDDSVRAPLLYVVENFAQPLLEVFAVVSGQVEAASGEMLVELATSLRLVCNIFYSLTWIEVCDLFVEQLETLMGEFLKYLEWNNPELVDDTETDEPGPQEMLQTAVMEVVNLFAEKWDEDFEPYFQAFIQQVWTMLTTLSTAPKYDRLVTTAIKFLSSVVGKKMHEDVFKDPGTLHTIMDKIVVPNLILRETDEELFEDNPVEYIRRDIEGSDNDTRRRCAADLVREMCKPFQEDVTALSKEFLDKLLADAAAAADGWKSKDAAIALVIALTVRSATRARGVSEINELVPIGEIYEAQILPELEGANVDENPVVKAAAIKFVSTFRNQLPKELLMTLIGYIGPFLGSSHYVVHTYAAAAIERMLTVRVGVAGAGGAGGPRPLAVTPDDLEPYVEPLMTSLFALMNAPDYPENDYLMKCVMRIVNVCKTKVTPHIGPVLESLTAVLKRVCANPSQPHFNHFLFETVAVLVRNVCAENPASAADFEANLFPVFQGVLEADVLEFLPYVFQLMAQLLDVAPPSDGAAPALSEAYTSLFAPLLTAENWSRRGNVPALARLIRSYVRRDASFVVSSGSLVPVLGIFQKLVSSRFTEDSSFAILHALLANVTAEVMSPYVGEVMRILFLRSQSNDTTKFHRHMITSIGLVAARYGPDVAVGCIEAVQANLTIMFTRDVFCPNANKVLGTIERRITQVGWTRVLCETPALFLADDASIRVWSDAVVAIVQTFEVAEDDTVSKEEEDAELALEENTEYTAQFAQLAFAAEAEQDPVPEFGEAREFLVRSLAELSTKPGGDSVKSVIESLFPPEAQVALQKYFSVCGVTLGHPV
mmetsp:Transcript_22084/g.77407  ORF Transcript_22084/g.77407 Transcript_22084/m.77407 type:complete len:992 (-) Transcript_22084:120-3095(-)